MFRRICLIGFIIVSIFSLGPRGFTQEIKRIGLVPASRINRQTGEIEVSWQQKVWQRILKPGFEYDVYLLEEEDLLSLKTLRTYTLLIIPQTRYVLSQRALDNLRKYVREGGKLVREHNAVIGIDKNGDGVMQTEEVTREIQDVVKDFWREIAGALPASSFINLIQTIRFSPDFPLLSKDLPLHPTPVNFPKKYRGVVYYTLFGAETVAEAGIDHIGSWNWEDEVKELEGVFPVITLNQYGKGYCLSLGINNRVILQRFPQEGYDIFFSNLISWAISEE